MPVIHGEPKTQFIKFRLSPTAYDRAKQQAARLGLSVDELGQLRLLASLDELRRAEALDAELQTA